MNCPFYTAVSPIHGRGLFANWYFPCGSILLKIADNQGKVNAFSQWVNHSWNPNISLHKEKDGWYAVATKPIYPGREIVGNYNFSPDCLEKAKSFWK